MLLAKARFFVFLENAGVYLYRAIVGINETLRRGEIMSRAENHGANILLFLFHKSFQVSFRPVSLFFSFTENNNYSISFNSIRLYVLCF